MFKYILFVTLIILSSSCSLFEEEVVQIKKVDENVHLLLGNPSDAQENALVINNYLAKREQFILGYNGARGIPTWVSWHLDASWLGSVSRSDDFLVDFSIPASVGRSASSDYSGSGFDRGHNCPSADRTLTRIDNQATFYMSNIIPQASTHNQELWREMEEFCRNQVRRDNKELYIIMGNYGEGGETRNGTTRKRIGSNDRVAVPQYIWKVVVIIDGGSDDLFRINENSRVIAILTQNQNKNLKDWYEYRVSIDEIEKETGLDLLSELPEEVQDILEARVDDGPV
ncbi:MAG: DNA/RNA non-specific endonuclease [Bacteroidota bacterium]